METSIEVMRKVLMDDRGEIGGGVQMSAIEVVRNVGISIFMAESVTSQST